LKKKYQEIKKKALMSAEHQRFTLLCFYTKSMEIKLKSEQH